MKTVCAWCGILLSSEPGEDSLSPDRVSHGICPACSARLLNEDGVAVEQFLHDLGVPVLLVTGDVAVLDANQPALVMLDKQREPILGRLGGEVFECVNASLPGGCGLTMHCSGCTLRRTVTETWEDGVPQVRVPATLHVRGDVGPQRADLFITTARVGDRVLVRIDPAA